VGIIYPEYERGKEKLLKIARERRVNEKSENDGKEL
jgi:hypothetical protein